MPGTLSGHVIWVESLKPLVGARVTISPCGERGSLFTDESGQFAFDELQQGRWIVRVRGQQSETAQAVAHIFDNAVTVVPLEIGQRAYEGDDIMSPSINPSEQDQLGSVRGRVIHAKTGTPLADAAVTVVKGAGPAPDIAPLTDGKGRFALDGLQPGDWVLSALAPGGEVGEVRVTVKQGYPPPSPVSGRPGGEGR